MGHCSNGIANAASKMLVIWALGVWVEDWLLHAQFSHYLGQLSIGLPFTQSVWELSHFRPLVWVVELIHSMSVCIWLAAPCMSHLVLCNLCLSEGWVVVDANYSTSSPGSQKPAAQVLLVFAKTAHPSRPTPPDTSWTWSYWGPHEDVAPGPRLFMLHFPLNRGLSAKRGPTVS